MRFQLFYGLFNQPFIAKRSEKKEFTPEKIKKSAEIIIYPKLTIDNLGIEYAKDVIILSEPYLVEIPKEKRIGAETKIWMIDLEYEGVRHQFTAQSGSFRFQLGVLQEKLGFENFDDLIGFEIKLWKQIANINTPNFKGNAEVYQILII